MILIYGKNPVGNVIHAILGQESEAWSDTHGALTVDITPLLRLCDSNVPVLLNISHCRSEMQAAHNIQSIIASGVQYPFLPGTMVMAPHLNPQQMEGAEFMGINDMLQQQSQDVRETPPAADEPTKAMRVKMGKCSRCKNEIAELVSGLSPAICFSCAKIDLYQARQENPPGNNTPAQGDATQDVS